MYRRNIPFAPRLCFQYSCSHSAPVTQSYTSRRLAASNSISSLASRNARILSQTYRTALIAVAGFLLTAVFHTGAAAQANSPQGVRNVVIVHGAWADGSSWSRVIP